MVPKVDCVGAPLKQRKGRFIERSESESLIEENTKRYYLNKDLYRKRQAMVEHQFVIIKRQWGFYYPLLTTKSKVETEFAIIFTCFNLRRSISILGAAEVRRRMKEAFCFAYRVLRSILSYFKSIFLSSKKTPLYFRNNLNPYKGRYAPFWVSYNSE